MSTDFEVDEGFDRRDLQPLPNSSMIGSSSTRKAKMCWEEEVQQDGGMDELLAMLGYQVRASHMAEVAQKLKLLEDLMGNGQGDGLSHLATETVRYNPSNLNARESVVTVREVYFFIYFLFLNMGWVWIIFIPYPNNSDNIHTLPG